jgi:hypothetical protein
MVKFSALIRKFCLRNFQIFLEKIKDFNSSVLIWRKKIDSVRFLVA